MRVLDKINLKINGTLDDPSNINFDIMGYHKKRTFFIGELILTEYFKNYDGINYSDKILEEQREYIRDNNNNVISRNTTINYFLENDEIGFVKTWVKFFNGQEAIQEGIQRRNNIITEAKSYLISKIGENNSFDLLLNVKEELNYYLEGYKPPLINLITNIEKNYLTEEIKMVLLSKLNYN